MTTADGRRLRDIRREKGLTHEELAHLIHARGGRVSLRTIIRIEKGYTRTPSINVLGDIADALQVPLEEITKRTLAVPALAAAGK